MINDSRMNEFLQAYGEAKFGDEWWPGNAHKWLSDRQKIEFADVLAEVAQVFPFAVYDEDGEVVGVDVWAEDEADAIAEFVMSGDDWPDGWTAQIQDTATALSDYGIEK